MEMKQNASRHINYNNKISFTAIGARKHSYLILILMLSSQISLHLFSSTMKCLLSAILVVTFSNLSLQFYSPPIQRAAPPPEPVCRQVPKEVCNQVPKTTYESVTKKQCRNVPDTVCADVQERKCQISQRPVQETVSRKQCRLQFRKDCKTAQVINVSNAS